MGRHAGQPIRAAAWPGPAGVPADEARAEPAVGGAMIQGRKRRAGGPPGLDPAGDAAGRRQAKFEVYGEEMIEKEVRQSGNSGRIYLPQEWVGKSVKVIRLG